MREHYKAEVTLTVGMLSVVFGVLYTILSEFTLQLTGINTFPLFGVFLMGIGGILTLIGIICGGADEDAKGGKDE